jgi:hypothetical protein
MEHKPDVVRIDNLEGLDLFFQFRGPRPFVALKAELDVFRWVGNAASGWEGAGAKSSAFFSCCA